MPKDPNHEAQVAAAQGAARAFVENPTSDAAQRLREAIDAIVWDD